MKFDRDIPHPPVSGLLDAKVRCLVLVFCLLVTASAEDRLPEKSESNADVLALRCMERLCLGDAFDAKLRQRIWASGREVVGVGHYEQGGRGGGRFSLEMTIHDGDTRQTMKQISDGKLVWVRTEIGGAVAIRRVDLGRIDEFERQWLTKQQMSSVAPRASVYRSVGHVSPTPIENRLPSRLTAGGLAELIQRIREDYVLSLKKGTVERQPVWILHGRLRSTVHSQIEAVSQRGHWTPLCPVEVRVAIAATADATGFGAGLPLRIEFYSVATLANDPTTPSTDSQTVAPPATPTGRLISLLEVYAMRRIEASPEERFRFQSDDREVTFTNDTKRYLDQIGIETESE